MLPPDLNERPGPVGPTIPARPPGAGEACLDYGSFFVDGIGVARQPYHGAAHPAFGGPRTHIIETPLKPRYVCYRHTLGVCGRGPLSTTIRSAPDECRSGRKLLKKYEAVSAEWGSVAGGLGFVDSRSFLALRQLNRPQSGDKDPLCYETFCFRRDFNTGIVGGPFSTTKLRVED